ncbi:MAG TPA: CBS domain-containing protein [Thermoanaerobaculia bacterium]|nr:CBS domain-containing protein [Thermoanaerobaculia bacterium]
MKAQDIMTRNPACCTASDTVQHAARLMAEHDCGCIPVVDDLRSKKIAGTITDRDIACRCTAEGGSPDTPVGELMSPNPSCCGPDADVRDAVRIMAERQVRRVPIVDKDGCCVGIIAQADLARAEDRGISDQEVGRVVERVSRPARRPRSEGDAVRPEVR